jgi:hypothetical protein
VFIHFARPSRFYAAAASPPSLVERVEISCIQLKGSPKGSTSEHLLRKYVLDRVSVPLAELR